MYSGKKSYRNMYISTGFSEQHSFFKTRFKFAKNIHKRSTFLQGKRMKNYALELNANLKTFFQYCIAQCSLGTAGAFTACDVTLL
jgi:hypothetical protein